MFLSDCFLISHIYIDIGERIAGKQYRPSLIMKAPPPPGPLKVPKWKTGFQLFSLVVHMSPLWWGLHLLTFWCPRYSWILSKGPTWPRIFLFLFLILTQKVLIRLLPYLTYSKTCLQGTLWRGDTLWSGDAFLELCPIFPMLKNLWRRDTCHVGTLSLGYWGVPWRQVFTVLI